MVVLGIYWLDEIGFHVNTDTLLKAYREDIDLISEPVEYLKTIENSIFARRPMLLYPINIYYHNQSHGYAF